MTRPPKYDVLFEPIQIGPKTMKNRFYQAPHCTGFGDVFPGAQAHHRGMKAEGGWAVVNTEGTTISAEFDWAGQMIPSRFWDEDDMRNWALLVDRAHQYDALVGIELHASGTFVTGFDSRLPTRHVNARLEEPAWMAAVIEMDRRDIREIQEQYVAAAIRARDVGFDIVNIWGGEVCTMPVQFLMNIHNGRTDEYGGSLENRARFWLETLEQVRAAVGDDCAIAARFCIDSLHANDRGIRVEEEGIGFIELADHLVDFWDVQVGGETVELWIKDAGPSRFFGENSQAPWVRKIRPHTNKPIVGVGRFTNPDTMVEAIRSGQLDIIGAARPSIADPFLPKKIEEGRFDEIRECIGCNVCVSRVNAGWHLICTQNATAGEEYRRGWHAEDQTPTTLTDRDVLVVGGGAAGMECAIALGKRGMRRVHLVEAGDELGGHLRWVSELPGMGEWRKVIDYRKIQLDKLANVEVITKRRLDAEAVVDYGAEIVIFATGAAWVGDGENGFTQLPVAGADARLPYVLTPEQVMIQHKPIPGDSVVVFDAEGYFMGATLAEKLARDGLDVTYVTPMVTPGMYMNYTGENALMIPQLHELGIELVTGHVVTAVSADGCTGENLHYPGGGQVAWPASAVVFTTQRLPNQDLYRAVLELEGGWADAGIEAVYRIGDCVAPRMQVADAIFDGQRLAREIDAENPAVAKPWIRERRVLGFADHDYDDIVQGAPDPAANGGYRIRSSVSNASSVAR